MKSDKLVISSFKNCAVSSGISVLYQQLLILDICIWNGFLYVKFIVFIYRIQYENNSNNDYCILEKIQIKQYMWIHVIVIIYYSFIYTKYSHFYGNKN